VRDRTLAAFRAGKILFLIATNVASRGLDITDLPYVLNFDIPEDAETYVHRIGRVGRAGREGVAITLAEPRERRLLANIERATKRPIPVEQVPSIAELRSRQLDATAAAVRQVVTADDLDRFGEMLDALAAETGVDGRVVAQAALKVAHEARTSEGEEVEIPEFVPREERYDRRERQYPKDSPGKPGGRFQASPGTKTRLFINLGRRDRIRPGDLVGAIANESDLTGKDIGPINVGDNFSTVDVPAAAADQVIAAIKRTTIRGKRANIRRDRHSGAPR
jgi:ATP-dependent RNA helicase DeaD